MLLGGGMNFRDYSDKMDDSYSPETDVISFNISPNVGLFLTDHLVLGIRPGFNYQRHRTAYNDFNGDLVQYTNESRAFSVGPFVRYYVSTGERISFFGEANAGFSFGKREEESLQAGNTTSYDTFGARLNVSPGIVFFAMPKLGFEVTLGSVGYNYDRSKNAFNGSNSEQNSRDFNFQFSLSSIGLGIQYYLGK